LHLLLGERLSGDSSVFLPVFCCQFFDHLINNACCSVCLFVETQRICGDGGLTFLNGLLCSFEMVFEVGPSLVVVRFVVPFSNVA
jgi:hypothetical protein